MKIYLSRHTQSKSNEANLADSQIDAELSSRGLGDAQHLVNDLQEIKPDVFYISPLKRTYETIKPYLNTLENPIVIKSPLLLERDLGDFTGTPMGAFQKYCDENNLNKITTRPPNGESLSDVYEKVQKFWEEIKQKYPDKIILICGHKNNLMCLQVVIENKNIMDYYSFSALKTGELRRVQ